MKNILRKFFDKIGKTGFMFLVFLPFGVWGLYHHGLPGLLAAILGWCVGNVIYKRLIEKRLLKADRRVR